MTGPWSEKGFFFFWEGRGASIIYYTGVARHLGDNAVLQAYKTWSLLGAGAAIVVCFQHVCFHPHWQMKKNMSPQGSEAWTEIDGERRGARKWDGTEMCFRACQSYLRACLCFRVRVCIYKPVCLLESVCTRVIFPKTYAVLVLSDHPLAMTLILWRLLGGGIKMVKMVERHGYTLDRSPAYDRLAYGDKHSRSQSHLGAIWSRPINIIRKPTQKRGESPHVSTQQSPSQPRTVLL